MIRAASGLAIITLVLTPAALPFLPLRDLVGVSAVAFAVGFASAAALIHGRRKTATGVFGGIAAGFLLKIAGIVAVYLALRDTAHSNAALLLLLTAYFFYYVWTSWLFHVSSRSIP